MEKHVLSNVEGIGTILKKGPLPFPISPRNSLPEPDCVQRTGKPEKECPHCGEPIKYIFMDDPFYLKITGREPNWKELPCETCERKRFLREAEDKAKAAQQKLNTMLANSMLRERFIDKTFSNFHPFGKDREKQQRVLSIARDFAGDFHRHRQVGTWLLFMGNVGTGKSHLCAAIINQVIRTGGTALFTKTPRLLREVKDTFHRDAETTQSEIISRMGDIDLLVIDEVGIQFGTDTERMILYEILDLRYEAMLPVILTTNITDLKSLEKLLGERIIDRLFEGESKIVVFEWESHRRYQKSVSGAAPLRKAEAVAPPSGRTGKGFTAAGPAAGLPEERIATSLRADAGAPVPGERRR